MYEHMANYRGVKLHEATIDNKVLTARFHLKFLLITQQEVPLKTRVKRQNRSSDRTENGKYTNVTSCVGPFYGIEWDSFSTPDPSLS